MVNYGSDLTEGRQRRFFYGYIVILAAFIIYIVMGGTFSTFGVFFKPMLTEFGWTRAMISGAYSLYALLFGLFGIVAGRLNDRLGPRFIIAGCSFLMGLGFLLMSQISAIWQLYLFYGVIIAAGRGSVFISLLSTISMWFVKRRGLMIGIAASGIGLGGVIMPPVTNWLIINYGWRTSYAIVGIIAMVLVVIAAQFLRREPSEVGLSPYGGGEIEVDGSRSVVRGFSLHEAIRTSQFWIYFAILLCGFFCVDTMLVHIVPHTTDLQISAANAANILAIINGSSIAGRLIIGIASDRIGNKLALIVSFILMSIALFWLLAAKEVWMFYPFAIIFGIGFGGTAVLISPIVAWLFGLSSHGVILGVVSFGASIGSIIGPFSTGFIFDATGSYHIAFLTIAIISTLGLLLAVSMGRAANHSQI
ncbi:MFS transporter [Chloroflexota bacterium]